MQIRTEDLICPTDEVHVVDILQPTNNGARYAVTHSGIPSGASISFIIDGENRLERMRAITGLGAHILTYTLDRRGKRIPGAKGATLLNYVPSTLDQARVVFLVSLFDPNLVPIKEIFLKNNAALERGCDVFYKTGENGDLNDAVMLLVNEMVSRESPYCFVVGEVG